VSWNHTATSRQHPSIPIEVQLSGSAGNVSFHPRLVEAAPGTLIHLYHHDANTSINIWETVHPCNAQTMVEALSAEAVFKPKPYLLQAQSARSSNGTQTFVFAELQLWSSVADYITTTVKTKLCDPHNVFTFRPLATQASASSSGVVKPCGYNITSKANFSTGLGQFSCHTMEGTICRNPARTMTGVVHCHTTGGQPYAHGINTETGERLAGHSMHTEPRRFSNSTAAIAHTGQTAGRLPPIATPTQNSTVPTGRKGPTVPPVVASNKAVLQAAQLPSLGLTIVAAWMLCM